jgi:hypothetical protein
MLINNTEFAPLPYDNRYLVSACGKVYSTISSRLLTPSLNGAGYYQVYIAGSRILLSRVVASTYLNMELNDLMFEVDHIDTNTKNNKVSNLQVMTKVDHRKKTDLERSKTGIVVPANRPCSICNVNLITHKNITGVCLSCKEKQKPQFSEEDIVSLLRENGSWVQAAKKVGLSDNGLRKLYTRVSGGKDPKLVNKKAH